MEQFEEYSEFSTVAKLIIGNKTDLDEKRQVSNEEGRKFSDSLGV